MNRRILTCVFYLFVLNREALRRVRSAAVLAGALVLLIPLQIFIGSASRIFWIPGMMLADGIMFGIFLFCGGLTVTDALYCLTRAFILAELTASLEWQLYTFFANAYGQDTMPLRTAFMIVIYAAVYVIAYLLERKQTGDWSGLTPGQLRTPALIAVITFVMSNLSYVYVNTPFTSQFAEEVFNIRTLVDICGFSFLYAYHIQRCEIRAMAELEAIDTILKTQYKQYQISQESINIINHKYHDLKHQLRVLREESDPEKREAFLDEIEQGVREYDAQFKTGNHVLDTILTEKSMFCVNNGITLTCVADGSLLSGIRVMDLCTIFGNALDNAVEYELKLADPEKRLIHITVSDLNHFTFIRFENYIEQIPEMRNGLPVTTKKDEGYHGLGLKSIRYLADQYGGTMSVSVEDNWFVVKVLIPRKDMQGI